MTTRDKVYATISILLSLLAISLIWRYFDADKQYTGVMSVAMIVVISLIIRIFTRKGKGNT